MKDFGPTDSQLKVISIFRAKQKEGFLDPPADGVCYSEEGDKGIVLPGKQLKMQIMVRRGEKKEGL